MPKSGFDNRIKTHAGKIWFFRFVSSFSENINQRAIYSSENNKKGTRMNIQAPGFLRWR
jgi:hypothetical protein